MTELLVFALFVIGGVYVVTESSIFQPVRIVASVKSVWLDVLLHCPKCVGFWVAAAIAICGYTPPLAEGAPFLLRLLWTGLCGIAVALVAVNWNLLGFENETERELILFLRRETADDEKPESENSIN